jgi:hypothetical protein
MPVLLSHLERLSLGGIVSTIQLIMVILSIAFVSRLNPHEIDLPFAPHK